MRKPTTRLVPWVGGKGQLMWAIQMLLPSHYKTLVDVFGGSGIITLNTAVPRGCLQIYNDLNHDLYNLLFCAKERPMELVRELGFLPINAHDEFDVLQRQLRGEDFTMEYMEQQLDLTEILLQPPQAEIVRQLLLERGSLGNVRRAAAFYKLQRYSYNSSGDNYGGGSCDIRRFFHDIWECSHRLKNVVLENKDFESIIAAHNDLQTVVYCDPPYYEAECYAVEFPRSDHQRLHDALEELGLSGISLSAWLGQDHILLMPQEMTALQLLHALEGLSRASVELLGVLQAACRRPCAAGCERNMEDMAQVPENIRPLLMLSGCCPSALAQLLEEGDIVYAAE